MPRLVVFVVIELRLVDRQPMLVEVEVDSEVRLLLLVLRLVESEPMPVEVEVDSEVIGLFALDRPVDVDNDVIDSVAVSS